MYIHNHGNTISYMNATLLYDAGMYECVGVSLTINTM